MFDGGVDWCMSFSVYGFKDLMAQRIINRALRAPIPTTFSVLSETWFTKYL